MAVKSLGTLTLDLVAKTQSFEAGMDRASRKAQTSSSRISRDLAKVGAAVSALSAGAVAGVAEMVRSLSEAGQEVTLLSRLAGTSTTDFQRFSYAASQVGIEQDKLADILKDVNDRVGDFLATGGGPMADFFEKVGPLVGVTADNFRALSGPQSLQLFVDSLQKAGLSSQEMTFYLEAMASDATALLPLLRDNGRELERLGNRAEAAGKVLSEQDLERLRDSRLAFEDLQIQVSGVWQEITLSALPAIQDLIRRLAEPGTLEGIKAFGQAIVTAVGWASSALSELTQKVEEVAESFARFTSGPDTFTGQLEQAQQASRAAREELQQMQTLLSATPSNSFLAGEVERQRERVRLLELEESRLRDLIQTFETPRPNIQASLPAESALGQGSSFAVPALDESELADVLRKQEELNRKARESALSLAMAQEDAFNEQAERVAESLRTEEERIRESYARRREIIEQSTRFSGEEQAELIRRLDAETQQSLASLAVTVDDTLNGQIANSITEWSIRATDSIVEMAATGKARFSDFAESVLRDLARMIIQLQVIRPLFSNLANFFGVRTAPVATAAVAGPGPAAVSAMGGGGVELAPLKAMGAPRAVGASTTVIVNNQGGAPARVTERETPGGGREIQVFVEGAIDAALGRGRFDRTLGAVYGLKRRGG